MRLSYPSAIAVRAPLRWAGSKRKSLPTLVKKLPAAFETYIEPFAGSACLVFAAIETPCVIGDINPDLIAFYEILRDNPEEVYNKYAEIDRSPETYYRIRKSFNEGSIESSRAAEFLYLNRHCFNGIYRVNASGKFNVPWGGDNVGKPLTLDELSLASKRLEKSRIVCGDFEKIVLDSVTSDSFVFLDPPYASCESRVFREYHENSFSTLDWDRLLGTLEEVDKVGAKFMMSYAGASSFVQKLNRWNVSRLEVTRNVGGFKASRRKYQEVFVTNYETAQ